MTSKYEAKIARYSWISGIVKRKAAGEATRVLDLCLKSIQACWMS